MYAIIRRYDGFESAVLADLARRHDEIESLILRVPGLISYHLVHVENGLTTVTVCEDQDGAEESNHRVATWVRQNMPGVLPQPEISGGEVLLTTGR